MILHIKIFNQIWMLLHLLLKAFINTIKRTSYDYFINTIWNTINFQIACIFYFLCDYLRKDCYVDSLSFTRASLNTYMCSICKLKGQMIFTASTSNRGSKLSFPDLGWQCCIHCMKYYTNIGLLIFCQRWANLNYRGRKEGIIIQL